MTLLSHYWRHDDPSELTAAIGQDWADVLEGLPQECIQRACIEYQRQHPRKKPTPGAIYEKANSYLPKREFDKAEAYAKIIEKGQTFVNSSVSPSLAREMLERELLVEDQLKAVGLVW